MHSPPAGSGGDYLAVGQAQGAHWGLVVKAALESLGPLTADANVGFVYVTPALADDFSSIVTLLRGATPVGHWFGAVGHGVIGPEGAASDGAAVVLMAGRLDSQGLKPFDGADPVEFVRRHDVWLRSQQDAYALVHGDAQAIDLPRQLEALAAQSGAFLAGGLAFPGGAHVAGQISGASLSGLLLGDAVPLLTGISQGCQPIGPSHVVGEALDNVVMTLDGRPALEVLKEEAGEIIARRLARAAGYIHVALPGDGQDDDPDYAVRNLLGIDPQRAWLAVGDYLQAGDRLMFVRRDANAARADLARMLEGMARRLQGRAPKGGLYIACLGRGAHMFGDDGREAEMIREHLGDFPLIGFSASGEIWHNRLYGYTGILVLFL